MRIPFQMSDSVIPPTIPLSWKITGPLWQTDNCKILSGTGEAYYSIQLKSHCNQMLKNWQKETGKSDCQICFLLVP